jgi:type I restriction enzyme S subunit
MSKNSDATIALLEKHFDIAFAAPDGIKKLRELILSLAMQGKLVPQNPKDQPASELLKEIEADKKRLVKDGKIKKFISLPLQNKPINSPKGWQFVSLNHVSTKIHYGYTTSANHGLKDVRLLRITDIQDNKVDWGSVPGCDIKDKDISQYLLANNDILIARTGGTVGKSYLVENINIKAVFASYLIRVVPSKHIDVTYLKLFMESPLYWKQLYEKCSGTGQPNVNGTSLSTLLLPLPPLNEQRRIVAKIDELMARCDELKRLRGERDRKQITVHTAALNRLLIAKEQSDFNTVWQFITQHFSELYSVKENVTKLRKAILQLAVMGKLVPQDPNEQPASELLEEIKKEKEKLVKEGKIKKPKPLPKIKPEEIPYEVPKTWEWARLGDVSLSSDSGWSPQCLSEPRSGQEWGVLKVSAVSWGEFKPDENKALPQGIEPKPECEVRSGDFLMSRANTDELVARSVVVKVSPPHLMMSDKIVRFNLSQKNNKDFINYTNSSHFSRDYYARNASGTSSSMKNISREVMNNLPIPIPPLAEQQRIVTKIFQVMALCDNLEKQIDNANSKQTNLLNAVMTKI